MGDPMTNECYHAVQHIDDDDEFAGAAEKFPIDILWLWFCV